MADDELERRIASVEQVRAQWLASIPRLLDKLGDLKKIDALEARVRALEEAAAKNAGSQLR